MLLVLGISFLSDLSPASLPSSDLHYSLHRPPVHQILVHKCPVCNLVVPGQRHAMEGRQARPVPKTRRRMEVHEGLFPHLGEYESWLGCDQG